nr:NAD(P)H-dependent oxidoreductase [Vibrio furnissii]
MEIPIKDLPLYSQDYDANYPDVAQAFKQAIADCDGLLFVTPSSTARFPDA